MKIAVIANEALKEELLAQGTVGDVSIKWLKGVETVAGADCYIDLLFTPDQQRIDQLNKLQPALVMVNEVISPLAELGGIPVRFNSWPGLLKRSLVEASCNSETTKASAEKVFSAFNKTIEWVPDIPGFFSARVISMIINEAYFTLNENVSSKAEIDTAMKLGTNYPYGPFEWGEKIQLKNVYDLLAFMARASNRYEPSALLKKDAFTT